MQLRDSGSLGKTLIIANPAAQSGAARGVAERMQRFCALYSHETDAFSLVCTEHAGHAIQLAREAKGFDTVLALGGDGVVHEVACGLMRIDAARRPRLGVVPVGSGNDYARTLGIPADQVSSIERIFDYEPVRMDVGKIEYVPSGIDAKSATARTEYFVQTFSFGLDAAIAIDTVERRRRTGLTGGALYTASGLDVFGRRFRTYPTNVQVDGTNLGRLRSLIFAVQLGPTYGSGFKVCPDADPTDGLFDICYAAGSIPRGIALPLFLRAKNGGHVKSKLIHLLRGKRLVLDFEGDDYPIQADGEQIRAHKATVSVLPGALTVLKPHRDVTK